MLSIGQNGTRFEPPEPFSVALYRLIPANSAPVEVLGELIVADIGCALASVVTAESSHPLIRYLAAVDLARNNPGLCDSDQHRDARDRLESANAGMSVRSPACSCRNLDESESECVGDHGHRTEAHRRRRNHG